MEKISNRHRDFVINFTTVNGIIYIIGIIIEIIWMIANEIKE